MISSHSSLNNIPDRKASEISSLNKWELNFGWDGFEHLELHDSLKTMKSWTYQINVLHQKYELNENTNPAAGSKHVRGYANPSDEFFSENNENFILHDTRPQAISKQKHQHKELGMAEREKSHKWIFQHHGTCDLQKEINDIFYFSPFA